MIWTMQLLCFKTYELEILNLDLMLWLNNFRSEIFRKIHFFDNLEHVLGVLGVFIQLLIEVLCFQTYELKILNIYPSLWINHFKTAIGRKVVIFDDLDHILLIFWGIYAPSMFSDLRTHMWNLDLILWLNNFWSEICQKLTFLLFGACFIRFWG